MPKPSSVVIRPLVPSVRSDFSVAAVRSIVRSHESADFAASAQLIEGMGRDAEISGCLNTRVRALASRSGLPFSVVPHDGADRRRAKAHARRVEEIWWDVTPEPVLADVQRDTIMAGASVGFVTWSVADFPKYGKTWLPRLNPLPLHGLSLEEYSGRWLYLTEDGPLEVTPGDGTWFLHLPHGARSWMHGAVRALALPFVMRLFALRDWTRYSEKHGMPILAVSEPSHAGDQNELQATAKVYEQFSKIGSEATLRLPVSDREGESWDAKWLELTSTSHKTFPDLLEKLDHYTVMTLLGKSAAPHTKSLGGDGEVALERVRGEYLASDAEPLSTALRDQIWKPFGRLNEKNWHDSLAPWGRWNTRPPTDLAGRASTLNVGADAFAKLKALGVPIAALLEEFQVTHPDAGEPKATPAPKPPAAPPKPQPDAPVNQ